MEGPYARRVLPCFDEPSFKATYEVQLEHRTNMKALSNGLETGTETIDSRWSKTKFTTVHFMPTYLLAFIVHDYSSIQLTNTNGCLIRVWCPSHQISYADYALNISNLVQTYFDSYLDYEYPLAKEDHIAIQDFGAGAMENWGLITYQDFYLLHELDDSVSKTFYSLIITHELAHMWFGNLVTMEWWNDLWLNEGFATYMEHIGMNLVHPEFRRTETYYVNTVDRALKPDSLGTMPSVRAPVYANDKHISSQFSRITYQKGGSLLWMLEHLLTLDVFNAGIKSYLKERSYKNANAEHLWRQLTAADKDKGGLDIKKIMDTWTLQRGYPLVTLKRSTDGRVIEATQEIFLQLGENLEEEEFGDLGYKWWVPLTYLYKSGPSDKYDNPAMDWLDPSVEKTSIQLTGAPSTEWYLANAKMTGYYRVNYDETNWQRLLDQAAKDPNAFSEENKIGLLYDSESLAKAEIISMDIYKGFAQSFENNTLISQQAVLRTSSYFAKMLTRPSYGMKRRSLSNPSAAAQTYMQRLVEPLYVDSGWDENFMPDLPLARYETMDQFDITSTACQYGHEHCVSKATALFKEYVENPKQNTIPKNFRKVVYCNGIRFGDKVEWDFAFDMLQASDDRWERSRWISALACSADHSRLKRYLQSMLDTATYSRHDDALILMGVAQNPDGYEVAWEFVRNNWETVGKMFKRNNQLLRDVLEEITSNFNTNEKLQELLDFGEGRDLGAMKVAYDSAVVTTKVNIRWMANKAAETEQWIASRIQ
ncbi:aminopeptidase N-like isoform X2 [Acanthaster planci]|nr:aminopeptidase N-like isoform X2 [Acanthaster planci]